MIIGHELLRSAARDWQAYSSATPFRVPIPEESSLRGVQQLPIETDPPEHGACRRLIEDRFSRAAADRIRPLISELVASRLSTGLAAGSIAVVEELALPVVTRAIAETLGRPGDTERLHSWGIHVFTDPLTGQRRRNDDVDAYIEERADSAISDPGDDLFGDLARARLGDRTLTRDEIMGFGSLVLAGGRDTVITAIVGAFWHLATHPAERRRLRGEQRLVSSAVEEYLRFFSPLGFIGRTATSNGEVDGFRIAEGDLVGLGFAEANHDERVFADAGCVVLDRRPNRHVAFGHGPHTCIGAPLARMQIAVAIEEFVRLDPEVTALSAPWVPPPDSGALDGGWLPLDLRLFFAT